MDFMNTHAKCPKCGRHDTIEKMRYLSLDGEPASFELQCTVCWHTWIQNVKGYEKKKEATTMQVSYNGFTGELVKLERHEMGCYNIASGENGLIYRYDLSIYDSEKQVTHSFTGVKMEDMKFLGGAVSFGE